MTGAAPWRWGSRFEILERTGRRGVSGSLPLLQASSSRGTGVLGHLVGLWEGVFSADILVGVREVEAVGDYGA